MSDPRQCPKYKLYPANRGLHPKNALAVELYMVASRDLRAGMDGVLIGTLTASDAASVLDLYEDHFGSSRARQQAFELMLVLDRVVTDKRSEAERRYREEAAQRQEAKSRNTRRK